MMAVGPAPATGGAEDRRLQTEQRFLRELSEIADVRERFVVCAAWVGGRQPDEPDSMSMKPIWVFDWTLMRVASPLARMG
jgi:hypothetical protein